MTEFVSFRPDLTYVRVRSPKTPQRADVIRTANRRGPWVARRLVRGSMRHARYETPSAPGFESAIELTRETSLEIEGSVPVWLRGRLIHTGPALFALPHGAYNHWFDGLAMLTGVHFVDGR